MTQQESDWVFYRGRRYQLLHDTSGMLPMRDELGIRTMLFGTSTQRGYIAEYEIEVDYLYLTMLKVGSDQFIDQFPPIGDIYPTKELFGYTYQGERKIPAYDLVYRLKYPMQMSGTITIKQGGKDNRQDENISLEMPLIPEILKLKMEKGHVEFIKNVTETHERLRRAIDEVWLEQYSQMRKMAIDEWFKYRAEERAELERQYYDFLQEEIE